MRFSLRQLFVALTLAACLCAPIEDISPLHGGAGRLKGVFVYLRYAPAHGIDTLAVYWWYPRGPLLLQMSTLDHEYPYALICESHGGVVMQWPNQGCGGYSRRRLH